jgi:hypothetical protein
MHLAERSDSAIYGQPFTAIQNFGRSVSREADAAELGSGWWHVASTVQVRTYGLRVSANGNV